MTSNALSFKYELIQSAKTRHGVECDSDHENLTEKFRLNLKKIGKTTRPFKCDLNQIPYDYTAEVTDTLKGLDLVDRVPKDLWTEILNIVQKCKWANWLSGEFYNI